MSNKTLTLAQIKKRMEKAKGNKINNRPEKPTKKVLKTQKEKAFVKTTKQLDLIGEKEKNMRIFLEKVSKLQNPEFIKTKIDEFDQEIFVSGLVEKGFQYYLKTRKNDYLYENPDVKNINAENDMRIIWKENTSIGWKKFLIIGNYGDQDKAEFGRKKFITKLIKLLNPKNEYLDKFINDYISQALGYQDYLVIWEDINTVIVDKMNKKEDKEEIEYNTLLNNITKNKKSILNLEEIIGDKNEIVRALRSMRNHSILKRDQLPKSQRLEHELVELQYSQQILRDEVKNLEFIKQNNPTLKIDDIEINNNLQSVLPIEDLPREEELNTYDINILLNIVNSLDKIFPPPPGIKIQNNDNKQLIIDRIMKKETRLNPRHLELRKYSWKDLVLLADDLGVREAGRMTTKKKLIYHIILKEKILKEKTKNRTKIIIHGKKNINWDRYKRKNELSKLSDNDLTEIYSVLGVEIFANNRLELINIILGVEEWNSRIISEDEYNRQLIITQLTTITGFTSEQYSTYTLDDLTKELKEINIVENIENPIDKNSILQELITLTNKSESDYKNWTFFQIQDTLNNIKNKPDNSLLLSCMKKRQKYEWIDGSVNSVWITDPLNLEISDFYIYTDSKLVEDGKTWYKVRDSFNALQCNTNSNKRSQSGEILTCFTNNGKKVIFIVGYLISGYIHDKYSGRTISTGESFIIQNEELFLLEKQFLSISNITIKNQIKDLLNSNVSSKTIDYALSTLASTFSAISPKNVDYNLQVYRNLLPKRSYDPLFDSPSYLRILINTLLTGPEQTNRNLFTNIADIIVYLQQLPEAQTFRNNVFLEYYLPDVFITLSQIDKFPEVFDDPNISNEYKDRVSSIIHSRTNKIVENIAKKIISYTDSTSRIKTNIQTTYLSKINTNKKISTCQNPNRVLNEPPENIIYYNVDNNRYCFKISELFAQFTNGNIINPDTGINFSLDFIQRFNELYNLDLKNNGFLQIHFANKYNFNLPSLNMDITKPLPIILAPDLWKFIKSDITELENELSGLNKDDDEIDFDPDRSPTEIQLNDLPLDTIEVCKYCKEHIKNTDPFKTIIFHPDGARITNFCSLHCFEDHDEFPKINFSRKSSSKSNKHTKPIQNIKIKKLYNLDDLQTLKRKERRHLLKTYSVHDLLLVANKNKVRVRKNLPQNLLYKDILFKLFGQGHSISSPKSLPISPKSSPISPKSSKSTPKSTISPKSSIEKKDGSKTTSESLIESKKLLNLIKIETIDDLVKTLKKNKKTRDAFFERLLSRKTDKKRQNFFKLLKTVNSKDQSIISDFYEKYVLIRLSIK
jgi:hypothetical protein